MSSNYENSEFSHYVHPHYIFNILVSLVYPILRNFGLKTQSLKAEDSWGFQREYSILTGISTMIILRFIRYYSNLRKYINEIFFYLKLGNGICLFFADFRLACWYMFLCFITWLVFRPPRYSGSSNFVEITSEDVFHEKVLKKNMNVKCVKGVENFVFCLFYSNYSENCIYTEDIFARLSLKYQASNLSFVKVDVDNFPNLCNEFKIVTTGFQAQLPVIIMFKNGQVLYTYPGQDTKGRPLQSKYYREKELTKFFDLENIYMNAPKINKNN